jgi:phage-related protein
LSDFDYQPLNGAQVANKPKVLSSRFGDGYEQRVTDGINANLQSWNLNFVDFKTTIDTIEAFIASKGAVNAFTWTPSGFAEVKVICREWARNLNSKNVHGLSCTFEQVAA